MSDLNLPAKIDNVIISNPYYLKKIKNTISECSLDIKKVSNGAANLNASGGGLFQKGANIRELSGYLATLSTVQQRTLDLVVLLMGATGRMKQDYNVIIESIDELSKSHAGSVEVLDYLVKIKNTFNEIKRRDELLDSLITFSNALSDNLAEMEVNYKKEHTILNETVKTAVQNIGNSIHYLDNRTKTMQDSIEGLKNSINELGSQHKTLHEIVNTAVKNLWDSVHNLDNRTKTMQESIDRIQGQIAQNHDDFISFQNHSKLFIKRTIIAVSTNAFILLLILIYLFFVK